MSWDRVSIVLLCPYPSPVLTSCVHILMCFPVHTFVPLFQSGKDPETLCHMT